MDTWLWLVIIALLLFGLAVAVSEIELLRWRLRHEFRAPTGTFKLTVPPKEWEQNVKQGAFGIGMTNQEGNIVFTLIIQKEQSEVKGGESSGKAGGPVPAMRRNGSA